MVEPSHEPRLPREAIVNPMTRPGPSQSPPGPRWVVPAVVLAVIASIVLGLAGVFLAPIAGGLVVLAIVVWMLTRRATGKPAIDPRG